LSALGPASRRLLALTVVLIAAVPMVLAPNRVALAVDGEVREVEAYAATVGEFLARHHIDVALNDLVLPPTDTELVDGMTVEVMRAVPVLVYVQGSPRTIEMAPLRVADVIDALSLSHVPADAVTPPPSSPWQPGIVIRVSVPLDVTVTADGDTRSFALPPGIVADAIASAGVQIGEHDFVTPALDATLGSGMSISVTRVAMDEAVEEIPLPFQEEVVETADLYKGDKRVVQEGQEGLQVDIYRVTTQDGVEVARELVRTEIAREPRNRIVHVGTKARPVAPTVASGSVWDQLAQCESGGNWASRGTYHGGLQFHPDTWNRWKPAGYPQYAYEATRDQQIEVGKRLQAAQGWYPWPHCAHALGLL